MTEPAADPATEPRAAATVVLVRRGPGVASVLMGLRGDRAVFMPSKYVFPGGGLDASDYAVPLAANLGPDCAARVRWQTDADLVRPLSAAAIRELYEETGLLLGTPGQAELPDGWQAFSQAGLIPTAAPMRFFFRAITPPGRTRRFDARFFVADAAELACDPDDFSRASDELSHLHWVSLAEARALNLPFITEVVLAELAAWLGSLDPEAPLPVPPAVAFFDNSGPVPTFRRIT